MKVIWPESFVKNDIEGISDDILCSDALTAWANAMMEKRPETFGKTMVKIAKKLNISTTPEAFVKWAEERKL